MSYLFTQRYTHTFLLIFMMIFCSCEKEVLLESQEVEVSTNSVSLLTEASQQSFPEAKIAASKAFRDTYYAYEAAIEQDNYSLVNPEGFEEEANQPLYKLQIMEAAGWIDQREIDAMRNLSQYLTGTPFTEELTVGNMREYLEAFEQSYSVSLETTPVAYHGLQIVKRALFETQIDYLGKNKPVVGAENEEMMVNCAISTVAYAPLEVMRTADYQLQ